MLCTIPSAIQNWHGALLGINMYSYYIFLILIAESRETIFISPNARHLLQLSGLVHTIHSFPGLLQTYIGNEFGKTHFHLKCLFLVSPLYHLLYHCCQPFPFGFHPFFFLLIFTIELLIKRFPWFTYDIFSILVMMKFSWKDLSLDYAQENLDSTQQFAKIMAA